MNYYYRPPGIPTPSRIPYPWDTYPSPKHQKWGPIEISSLEALPEPPTPPVLTSSGGH